MHPRAQAGVIIADTSLPVRIQDPIILLAIIIPTASVIYPWCFCSLAYLQEEDTTFAFAESAYMAAKYDCSD